MANSAIAFLYQLQGANYQTLSNTNFKVAVVDDDSAQLAASQLSALKATGKAVFGYLSIGEAEDYRSYWQPSWNKAAPSFVLGENGDWEGNYRVKFWDAGWQKMIIEKAVALVKEGYSGITLDVVDVYTVQEVAAAYHGSSDVRSEMMSFIGKISDATKAINPAFKVMTNNGLDMLTKDAKNPASGANLAYLGKIDAVNAESTFFMPNNAKATWSAWNQHYLDQAVHAGKDVFAIDYPSSEAAQQSFITQALAKGYIPFVGNLSLNGIDATNHEIFPRLAAGALDKYNAANLILNGSAGNDVLRGGTGNDTLTGKGGNDVMFGGAGDDHFVFGAASGQDMIYGFSGAGRAGGDVIAVSSSVYHSAAEVLAHIHYGSGNALVDFGNGHSVTLDKIAVGALTVDDFAMVA